MSRQSQVNSFNDGMNKDLNPLLTPSTVMTDCLNGTIVTYNGNEFALQNDLGNYKFKFGSLENGFVPIGIKEYSNILYIISYNPILDQVEIGSFPSMKTIFTTDIKNWSESNELKLNDKISLYSDLANKSHLTLLSPLTDDYIINPGDKYILECGLDDPNNTIEDYIEEEKRLKIWQHVSTYILTKENKLYNIDNFIKTQVSHDYKDGTIIPSEFQYVKWEVPGYLAIKTIPNVMDEFNCYITDFGVESNIIEIKAQTIWSNNYKELSKNLSNNIFYLYTFFNEGEDPLEYDLELLKNSEIENHIKIYNDLYFSIHCNIPYNKFENNFDYVKIVPVLLAEDDESFEKKKYIIYDQFETVLSLNKVEFDKTKIKVGGERSTYTVYKDKINIDIDIISSPDVDVSFCFSRLDDDGKFIDVYKKVVESEINYSGQNIFDIEFDKNRPDNSILGFDKEDVYEMTMYIYPKGYDLPENQAEIDGSSLVWFSKSKVYLSEIINEYSKSNDKIFSFSDNKADTILNDEKFASLLNGFIGVSDFTIQDEGIHFYNINNYEDKEYVYENFSKDIKSIIESWGLKSWVNGDFNKEAIIKYGTKYKINLSDNLLILPKDQYGNVGRIWSNNTIKSIDINSESVNVTSSNDEFWINLITDNKINASFSEISDKPYPIDTSSMIGGKEVSLPDDNGWCELQRVFLYHKDYDVGKDKVSCAELYPQYKMFFKILSSTEILLKINSPIYNDDGSLKCEYVEYTLKKDGIWTSSPTGDFPGLYEVFPTFFFKNDKEKYIISGKDETECSDAILKNTENLSLVIFYNNLGWSGDHYIKIQSEEKIGFSFPYIYPQDDRGSENRTFIGISAKKKNESDMFTIILPETDDNNLDYNSEDDSNVFSAYDYVTNVLASYFLLVSGIKYVNEWGSREMKKLYGIDSFENYIGDSVNIDDVKYTINIEFSGINNVFYDDIYNNLNKIKYEYSSNIDIVKDNTLGNKNSEILSIINSITLPDQNYSYNENINHCIDERYWDSQGVLNNFINMFSNYDKFTLMESKDWYLLMKMKPFGGWYNVCYMYSKKYEI